MITSIYILSDNGVIFYVGKTLNVKKRIYTHKHNNPNVVLEVIDEVETLEWRFWERFYISLFYSWGFVLTNKRNYAGVGCSIVSVETRNKLSKKLKGRGSPRKGYSLSEETKSKISQSSKGKLKTNAGQSRKGHSEETKLKMSIAKKGVRIGPHSEERKYKMRLSRIKRVYP